MIQDYPIVLGANRDEFYNRYSHQPARLSLAPAIWGGRDARAGGTWLGINEYGLVVGLTNWRLHEGDKPAENRRSRGLLCLDALYQCCAADVAELLATEPPDQYNAFNLLVLDSTTAFWIAYDSKPDIHVLEPGLHILANKNLNDMETRRVRRAHQLIQVSATMAVPDILPYLEHICGDHEPESQECEHLCMHRSDERYGTVSSTILAIATQRQKSVYRYAPGHPCQAMYQDYSSHLISHSQPHWIRPT